MADRVVPWDELAVWGSKRSFFSFDFFFFSMLPHVCMEYGESTGTYLYEVRMAVFYAGFYATPAVEPFSLPWGEADHDHASLQHHQGLPWGDESGHTLHVHVATVCSDTDIWDAGHWCSGVDPGRIGARGVVVYIRHCPRCAPPC